MKKVKITIHGDLLALDYCNVDKEFLDEYYYTCAWDKVEAMYVDGDEDENVVKKKGKYVKTKEYFHVRHLFLQLLRKFHRQYELPL